jgi:hypothetical protein
MIYYHFLVEVQGLVNDLSQIFRTNLFLATHFDTNCSSLVSVAVISVAVVADVYSVESSACIDRQALLKASGMSFVKIEKRKGA